jgi:hypothetical protein
MSSRPHVGRRTATRAALGGDRFAATRALRVVRTLHAHEHRTAAGLLALFVFAYLWPVLIGGDALAATRILGLYPPWHATIPVGLADVGNAELGDPVLLYLPGDVLARRLLHAGTFPAWNPYDFAGTPLFGNFQIAWLSPFSLPLWLLPLSYGLGVAAALKLWLAGFGTYLLVRELRLGFWPAMLAAVSFTLCAFNVVWLSHGVFVSAASTLPWGIWLTERLVRRGRPAEALALVAVVGVLQTSGHPGTQLHVLSAIGLYALARTLLACDAAGRERLRRLGLIAAALGLGTLLAAVVLLPAQRTSAGTIGVYIRQNGSAVFPGSSMPWHVLRSALFPEWWGRPSENFLRGPANYRERTFYAGGVALVLALFALVSAGAWRRKAPFALLALLGALISVRTTLHQLVVHLPLFDQVQDQRILLWFTFAIPVLAAFGLQQVLERPRDRRVWALVGAALLAALVAVLAIDPAGETLSQAAKALLDRREAGSVSAAALAGVGWWIALVLALAAALLVIRQRPRLRLPAAALVVLVAALDLLHFAHGYQPMIPASSVIPPAPPAVRFLQRHAGERRIAGVGYDVAPDFSSVYGLRDVRGRDVPQPSFRYADLWAAMGGTVEAGTIEAVTPLTAKVLGVLGARYLVANPGKQNGAHGLTRVYDGADATIFQNALVVPRAFVVRRVRVAAEREAEVGVVVARSFDARRDAVVHRGDLAGASVPSRGAGRVRVVAERNASVTLRATLARRSLVVLDDAWARGWSVRVDGAPARTLQTDVVLRGVIVAPGTHTIVWSYRVPGLAEGAALSGVGLLATLAWAGWLLVRTRRRRRRR